MIKTDDFNLTDDQKFKLELWREFGDEAKEVYAFLGAIKPITYLGKEEFAALRKFMQTQSEVTLNDITPAKPKDGVYIIYKDGSYQLFDGNNPKEDAKYVGVVMGEKSVAISLHDFGGKGEEWALVNDTNKCEREYETYTAGRINAFEDFDGKRNTEHIKACGSPIPFDEFEDGEYIPSLGECGIIMMNLTQVNKAMEYLGGDVLDGYFWSSTEYNSIGAWSVNFGNGNVNLYNKCYTNVVRAVAEFL